MEIERAGSSSGPSVREATALEAFNAPLFEVPPMIDVRCAAEFLKSHVICAVSAPAEDGHDEQRLMQRILDHDDEWGWCLQHPFFLIYDEASRERANWLASVLRAAVSAQSEDTGAESASRGEQLLRRVAFQCRQILMLKHVDFAESFSYCCAEGSEFVAQALFDRVGALPRCAIAEPRIYLAGRQVKLSLELLNTLGVTHVVVNADAWDVMDSTSGGGTSGPNFQDRPQDVPGVCYLKCEVSDRNNDPDLPKVLEGVARFLAGCTAAGGVSLVQIHGQSRSASALCAFLMLTQSLSPEDALQTLKDVGIQIDAHLVWWDALRQLPPLFAALEDMPIANGTSEDAMCE